MSSNDLSADLKFSEPIDDVGTSVHVYLWRQRRVWYLSQIGGSIALCLALYWLIFTYLRNVLAEHGDLVWLPLIVLAHPLSISLRYQDELKHAFARQLARSVGFRYSATGDASALTGVWMTWFRDRQIEDVLSGTYGSYPLRIYSFNFEKDEHTVFEFTIPGELVDIVMFPQADILQQLDTPLADLTKEMKAVRLEGDFNRHFRLFAPDEQASREIFQPDLMALLIDTYQTYALEICGDKVYVIADEIITNKAKFLAALRLADKLLEKLRPLARSSR